jgi:hypothetical protein
MFKCNSILAGSEKVKSVPPPIPKAAKVEKKRTSIVTWFVLAIVFLVGYHALTDKRYSQSNVSSTAVNSRSEAQAASTGSSSTVSKSEAPVNSSSWVYSEQKDEMRQQTQYFATNDSTNKADFDFPYNGGSTLEIVIRKTSGLAAMFTIDKGQFICYSNDCSANVKFDDQKIEKFSLSSSNTDSSTVLFVDNKKRFLNELKKSKKVIIELQFYGTGPRQFSFDSQGLEWKH